MKHTVRINVADKDGATSHVVTSRRKRIPGILAHLLFGGFSEVVVLNPGKSVRGIEVREVREDGEA